MALLAVLSCFTLAGSGLDEWSVARDSHFAVYSQTRDGAAESALVWFEELRAFFQENGLLGTGGTLRIAGFRSQKEYEEYRLRPIADAAYISDESGDFIVMASLQPRTFPVAAHEYAHYVLHANGLKLRAWMNEGLAEFFSTLKVNGNAYELGGDLPARSQTLRRMKWLPLAALVDLRTVPGTRKEAEIFYAESWALVDMLAASPRYSAHFREFVAELNEQTDAGRALRNVYGESLAEVEKRLRSWVGQTKQPRRGVVAPPTETEMVDSRNVSAQEVKALLAQLSLVSGHIERARNQYEELAREEPGNPNFPAALGLIWLREGNRAEAIEQWRQALSNGTTDAELCYRFALMAEEAGLDVQVERSALERAVALAPGLDDARYKLALLQSHAAEYRLAVEQLRRMRVPAGERRYAYWMAMADALTELDEREEAKQAAEEAVKAAQNEADREQARRMAYAAATDLTVQFATDAEGHSHMVTTRVPHGTKDWNPFIEPSDRMERASGALSEVLCAGGRLTGFRLRTQRGLVTVEVPDPMHVLMRNSPDEFLCGPVADRAVVADFAVMKAAGASRNVLRGMSFQ